LVMRQLSISPPTTIRSKVGGTSTLLLLLLAPSLLLSEREREREGGEF